MNFLTTPVLYGLTLSLLGALALAGGQCSAKKTAQVALADERAAHATTKTGHADVLRNLAELTARTADAVRKREREIADDLAAQETRHAEEMAHEQEERDRVVAAVRSGAVRLRDEWRGCPAGAVPAAAVPGDAGTGGGPDAAADLRAAGAADLVRGGASADRWIGRLQAYAAACQAMTAPIPAEAP